MTYAYLYLYFTVRLTTRYMAMSISYPSDEYLWPVNTQHEFFIATLGELS